MFAGDARVDHCVVFHFSFGSANKWPTFISRISAAGSASRKPGDFSASSVWQVASSVVVSLTIEVSRRISSTVGTVSCGDVGARAAPQILLQG